MLLSLFTVLLSLFTAPLRSAAAATPVAPVRQTDVAGDEIFAGERPAIVVRSRSCCEVDLLVFFDVGDADERELFDNGVVTASPRTSDGKLPVDGKRQTFRDAKVKKGDLVYVTGAVRRLTHPNSGGRHVLDIETLRTTGTQCTVSRPVRFPVRWQSDPFFETAVCRRTDNSAFIHVNVVDLTDKLAVRDPAVKVETLLDWTPLTGAGTVELPVQIKARTSLRFVVRADLPDDGKPAVERRFRLTVS